MPRYTTLSRLCEGNCGTVRDVDFVSNDADAHKDNGNSSGDEKDDDDDDGQHLPLRKDGSGPCPTVQSCVLPQLHHKVDKRTAK